MTQVNQELIDKISKLYEKYAEFRKETIFPWPDYRNELKNFDNRFTTIVALNNDDSEDLNLALKNVKIVTLADIGIIESESFADFLQQFINKFKKVEKNVPQPIIFSYKVIEAVSRFEVLNLCRGLPFYIQEKPEPEHRETRELSLETLHERLLKLEAIYDIKKEPEKDIVEETRHYTYYTDEIPGVGH